MNIQKFERAGAIYQQAKYAISGRLILWTTGKRG